MKLLARMQRVWSRVSGWVLLVVVSGVIDQPAVALTLDELRRDPNLTPRRLAGYFADFSFSFSPRVRSAEVFLATRSGDCDDFAVLAATILAEKGYTTRVVYVRMPDQAHAVCYVKETRCYLDFNNRVYLKRTVSTDGSLVDIARKVARSFDAPWVSVTESIDDGGFGWSLGATTINAAGRLGSKQRQGQPRAK